MRPQPISPSPRGKCFERSRSSDNSSGGRTSDIWHVQAGRSLKQPKRRDQKSAVPLIFFLQNSEKRYCHSSRRSEEHTSELHSHSDLVCRLLLEKKKNKI